MVLKLDWLNRNLKLYITDIVLNIVKNIYIYIIFSYNRNWRNNVVVYFWTNKRSTILYVWKISYPRESNIWSIPKGGVFIGHSILKIIVNKHNSVLYSTKYILYGTVGGIFFGFIDVSFIDICQMLRTIRLKLR